MGTTQPKETREQTEHVLVGVGRNPNMGAVLVVELGMEEIDAESIADRIASAGKPVETLSIREGGGTRAALETGVETATALNDDVGDARREEADASELVFGVECGGSDATSGIAANPAIGDACDRLVEDGGTACFSETPEFIGAEHILADRATNKDVRERPLGNSLAENITKRHRADATSEAEDQQRDDHATPAGMPVSVSAVTAITDSATATAGARAALRRLW